MYGFVRIGTAVPKLKVADCIYNKDEIIRLIREAEEKEIKVLTFPELSVTGYTCGDLFLQSSLLAASEEALQKILEETAHCEVLCAVGLPVAADNQTFNCAALFTKGTILGIVPKTYLPNYSEFYEKRWFSSSRDLKSSEIVFCGQRVPIGADILFRSETEKHLTVGVEICEDLWAPVPPSSYQSINGATVLLNLSASNELATKYEYRKALIAQQSARLLSAYAYAAAGMGESTQDMVFSGHSVIYENGTLLKESQRFVDENQLIYADVDLEVLANDRKKNTTYMTDHRLYAQYRFVSFSQGEGSISRLQRFFPQKPFLPAEDASLADRCGDIFHIQVTGLAKRIMHTNAKTLVIGISGGLDSTLALLVSVKALDFLKRDRKEIIGITMPGFGTTDRTYQNALSLMEALGITVREIPIRDSVIQHFQDIGQNPDNHDVTYENSQARERTQILMDIANMENGLVVGTGDLSELALGWATYNGDHMSMYAVNSGVPKTLVRVLVKWVADYSVLETSAKDILLDILDTPVSPELLPPDKEGRINQKTEEIVGPYELHDFFLYYVVRFGFSPKKIFFIAVQTFRGIYSKEVLLKWLKNFYRRFFSQQFKRSCMPDGPKVGTVSLSPRGDWRMPSDASSRVWVAEIEDIEANLTLYEG